MILSGWTVHLNGLASLLLCSSMKRRVATSHSATGLKIARLRRCLVCFAKNPSTAFSHEDEVGVKWNVQLGCTTSRARHLVCLVCGIIVANDMHVLARGHGCGR